MTDALETIRALVEEMRTQDNASTKHPLFIVQQKRRTYGMDADIDDIPFVWRWKEDWEYTCEPGAIVQQIREDVHTAHEVVHLEDDEIDPEELGYERLAYVEHWDFVTAHFTRKAAQRYIDENRHNLSDPRIYVSSQYRCREWIETIGALSEIVGEKSYKTGAELLDWLDSHPHLRPTPAKFRAWLDEIAEDRGRSAAPDGEHLEDRIARWRAAEPKDEECSCIDLVCDAEDELRRLRAALTRHGVKLDD
jgi:hypothetical protein